MAGIGRETRSRVAHAHEAATAARIGGAMLVAGGGLSVVLSFTVPGYANGQPAAVLGVSSAAMAIGGLCLWRPHRTPHWALPLLAPLGTLLISLAAWLTRSPADGSELLYMWPALYTAYFFRVRVAFANVALIGLVYTPIAIGVLGYSRGLTPSAYLLGTSVVTLLIVASLRRQLNSLLAASVREARTDRLTGLANRRGWDEDIAREITYHRREGGRLSLLMIDLDHFKQLNDAHGHAAGDVALAGVARELRDGARQSDVLARLGGEEFGLLLPGCGTAEATLVAEELRRAIEMASQSWATPVTVSIGVATMPEHATSAEGLAHTADLALYAAKRAGRNRVMAATASSKITASRRRAQ
jgi:diguanylate cyclase (GGDEF)-like protein